MPARKRGDVAAIIEQRIRTSIANGAIRGGDRLPSTRTLAAELGADPRSIAAAYRRLSAAGIVTLSPRSGVFLAKNEKDDERESPPSDQWLVDAVTEGIFRGCPVDALARRLGQIAAEKKPKVVVIAQMLDQAIGIARELHQDFGFETSYVLADSLEAAKPVPRAMQAAQVLLTTERFRDLVERLAKRMKKSAVVIKVRPDFIPADWVELLRQKVYVIGMDARMLTLIKTQLRELQGSENMVLLIAGHDDLSKIPPDAPTYVTEAARRFLGKTNIPGRLIKPSKLLDRESVRHLVDLMVAQSTFATAEPKRRI